MATRLILKTHIFGEYNSARRWRVRDLTEEEAIALEKDIDLFIETYRNIKQEEQTMEKFAWVKNVRDGYCVYIRDKALHNFGKRAADAQRLADMVNRLVNEEVEKKAKELAEEKLLVRLRKMDEVDGLGQQEYFGSAPADLGFTVDLAAEVISCGSQGNIPFKWSARNVSIAEQNRLKKFLDGFFDRQNGCEKIHVEGDGLGNERLDSIASNPRMEAIRKEHHRDQNMIPVTLEMVELAKKEMEETIRKEVSKAIAHFESKTTLTPLFINVVLADIQTLGQKHSRREVVAVEAEVKL